MNASFSMSQILAQFLPEVRRTHRLSPQQAKVTNLIGVCRTPALGGRRLQCGECDYAVEQYHSCRNRHCPQCQKQATEAWLAKRQEDLLPVPYFHLVFTLPHTLNGWVQCHPETMYAVLFRAVWRTLKQFGRDAKRLNGDLGMTAVLHTWGQNMGQHVHLHCLIPGGALSQNGREWHPAKSTYLFPVKALSRHYRGLMVSELRKAFTAGELHRLDRDAVGAILDTLMATPWVVYARGTCQHSDSVLAYLSRYTHRIAISERRIRAVDADTVTFAYKDYAANSEQTVMQLKGDEFVRRFLLHVLPPGLMRIRHYGFMANCHRRRKIAQIRHCLNETETIESKDKAKVEVRSHSTTAPAEQHCAQCPRCRRAPMRVVMELPTRRLRRKH